MDNKLTELTYGFDWGGIEVTRAVSHGGYKILHISTARRILEVVVTPTGLIRIQEHKRIASRHCDR